MNIAIPTDQFNIDNVFFQEAIKNTIMPDSHFIRIIYSDEVFMLNGICLEFTLPITSIDKSFNKFKCTFDKPLSNVVIQAIYKAEYDIIMKCGGKNKNKTPIFRICDQIKNGVIKVINLCNGPTSSTTNSSMTNSRKFIIKISGIWSNDLEYGLTYKFIQCL